MTAGLYRVLAARIIHGDHQEAHPGEDIMLSSEDAKSLLALGAVRLTAASDQPGDDVDDAGAEATLFGEALPISGPDSEEVTVDVDEGTPASAELAKLFEAQTASALVVPSSATPPSAAGAHAPAPAAAPTVPDVHASSTPSTKEG